MGTLDSGLHDILIYEMNNGEGKEGKYHAEGKIVASVVPFFQITPVLKKYIY